MTGDRVVVVGCGTVVPEPDRACSSYFVEARGRRFLFDCGPGAVQALARLGLPWSELDELVITHFHADHIGALPGLFFSFLHGIHPPRTGRALRVWGPPGTAELFERLADAFGGFILDPGFEVEFRELETGEEGGPAEGLRLRMHPTPHTDESRAVRLDSDTGSFGYTGDTGPSDDVARFLAGVDLLVCECSLRDEEVGDNHLSPQSAARIAAIARPGCFVLTHIYPHLRASADVADLVRAAGWTGEIRIAHEGLELLVGLTKR